MKEQYFKAYFQSSRWSLRNKFCPAISVFVFSWSQMKALQCHFIVHIEVLLLFNKEKVVEELSHYGTQTIKCISNLEVALGSRNFTFLLRDIYALLIFVKYWVRICHWVAERIAGFWGVGVKRVVWFHNGNFLHWLHCPIQQPLTTWDYLNTYINGLSFF